MHVASSTDPYWYPDTDATHHMISDACSMIFAIGNGQHGHVVVGNGDVLPITHIGNISFESRSYIFRLSQVLYVPTIRKNLLSIAKFTRDYWVSLSFLPWGFVIHDLKTGVILFQGPCEDGIYPIKLDCAPKSRYSQLKSMPLLPYSRRPPCGIIVLGIHLIKFLVF